jgi:hypothetical protein
MRQKFKSDDDGHWYLINAEDEAEFDQWVEHEESDSEEPWKGRDFNADRIPGDPSRWTFERAQIDQQPVSEDCGPQEKPISSARLEELKKQKFTPEGKEERIAKGLAALHQEPTIVLPTDVWRRIAEDPDLEDQF